MSQHPSQHPNYDDAASALIELAGNGNVCSAGISHDNGAIFVPGPGSTSQDKNMVRGNVSQTIVSPAKPSPVAVAAANRFPGKLMAVLNSDAYKTIISWSPDGKSFVFLDSNSFERVVLPSIFKVAKFDSFLRKLYRWGFSKCQTHSKVGCPAYKHEKFIRDRPNLITEMECRSKPKTQYGNVAPMTLRAFHQSAPELGESNKERNHNQNQLLNALWDQAWNGSEVTKRALGQSEPCRTDQGASDSPRTNPIHAQSSGNDFSSLSTPNPTMDHHQRKIMEAARAAILRDETFQNANIQALAQEILTNRQAAAPMGYNLIGNASNASDIRQQQDIHALDDARPFTARSKTTPSNMKFMEQPNVNANFELQTENNMPSMQNNASGFFSTDSNLGYQRRNPFLEQMNFGRSQFNFPNLQNVVDPSTGSFIDPMVAAELQAIYLQQERGNVGNINLIPDLQTLRMLQLAGSRTHLNDEVVGNLQSQNQTAALLQSAMGDRMQLQNEVELLRQQVDRQLQNQNASAREFLEKLAQNDKQFFGPS